MEEFVCFWIDIGVQPVALIPKLDHGFVKRNVTRLFSSCRL
ncbi:hypothetical protein SAMN05192552_10982 [Natrinema hispanicum]|uniref:Uncharacterized protein n=1 Tax=Natrinema hispanicum TaxID=392421 RepID=A0A1G6ZFB7_9EURY|nr:hypothetical protein SAMN05192552_10982 [Natrinema hispanicum]